MKTRNGFVSNSSSSSFFICGVHLAIDDPKNTDELLDAVSTYEVDDDGGVIIGESIEFDTDETHTYTLENFIEIFNETKDKLSKLGIDTDPRFFISMMYDNY